MLSSIFDSRVQLHILSTPLVTEIVSYSGELVDSVFIGRLTFSMILQRTEVGKCDDGWQDQIYDIL